MVHFLEYQAYVAKDRDVAILSLEKKFFEGVITKAVGGNYTVVTTDGVLTCNARGIFRKNKIFRYGITTCS